jgi:hypothetical protein
MEQDEPVAECKDERIQLLENKNTALKIENKALKMKLSKRHTYLIYKKSYYRLDGLYKHLRERDKEHKSLA